MKKIILLVVLSLSSCVFSQAPNISYVSPQIYTVGSTITPLAPINNGGAVPATIYGQVTTFAGTGLQGANDGQGNVASFKFPNGIGLDTSGNVYVCEQGNGKVRKITPTGVVSTFAGSGAAGSIDGVGTNASFENLLGLTIDSSNNIYVTDNRKIRKITSSGIVSTYAGTGIQGSTDGNTNVATFYGPNGITLDGTGNFYVSEYGVHKIRKISPTVIVSTLAGTGSAGSADGIGTVASFNNPFGMAIDTQGNLYIADASNAKIRKITPSGVVSTFAGSGTFASIDGTGTSASFNVPFFLAFDQVGNLYVSESYKIRKISPLGVVTSFVGSGGQGSNDGVGNEASFNNPYGLAFDSLGNLFVADYINQKIRKVVTTGYSISPFLPAGLNFDATTGIISGSPIYNTPPTAYSITAYNNFGESTTTVVISTSSLGTLCYSLNKLNLSPNPTTSILNFKMQNNIKIDKIVITDLTGKKVLEQNNGNQVNVANLANGLYVVEAFSGEEKWVSKFVKE